ncbi:hypothetical protein H5410_003402 [Solanum commersonii]|uniref:Uncharacterized protein n=1 Tax=Solanum commersonii TaxID=4109 RepID=A0A9J6B4K8_SOLCO|nr:hypothetical protein H5410_003402 [Solanum commersonii]
MKGSSQRVAKHFRKLTPYRPMIQNAKMENCRGHRQSELTVPKFLGDIVLELEDLKTPNSMKLEPVVIGSSWVQLERLNPRPSTTHSARESEWDNAETVLKCATRCSREIKLIRVTAPLELDPNPFGLVILLHMIVDT